MLIYYLFLTNTSVLACGDGEYMFEEIYDDVHLVKKYDVNSFSKFENMVNGPWLYRQFVCFVLYLTETINRFSKEHRRIIQTLNVEKKLFTTVSFKDLNLDNTMSIHESF